MQAGLGLTRNRHGNVWHTRVHVPKDMVVQLGRAEVRLSLGTEQRQQAIRAARLVHARKIAAFDEIRAQMHSADTPTPEKQNQLLQSLRDSIQQYRNANASEEHDDRADAARYAQEANEQQQQYEMEREAASLDPASTHALMALATESMKEAEQLRALLTASEQSRLDAIAVAGQHINKANEFEQRANNNANIARQLAQIARADRLTHATQVTGMANQIADLSLMQFAKRGASTPPTQDEAKEAPAILFSELAAAYLQHMKDMKTLKAEDGETETVRPGTQNRINKHKRALDLFEWATGDIAVKEITDETLKTFINKTSKLNSPFHLDKAIHPTIDDALKDVIKAKKNPTLAIVLERGEFVGCALNWARKEKHKNGGKGKDWQVPFFSNEGNPYVIASNEIRKNYQHSEKLQAEKKDTRRFWNSELEKIFITGTVNYRHRKIGFGNGKFFYPVHYWLPLIFLFTGARPQEICQLRLDDFEATDGMLCFKIFEDDAATTLANHKAGIASRTQKNAASARKIPVHAKLIELGLSNYIKSQRKKGEYLLFPETEGRYENEVRNFTALFVRRLGIESGISPEDGKFYNVTFYSFRQTFINLSRIAGVTEEQWDAIVGHKIVRTNKSN